MSASTPIQQLIGNIEQFIPREGGRQFRYFAYQAPFLPLAAGAAPVEPITIESDSDFLWFVATRELRDPANPATLLASWPALVMVNAGGNRNLFATPIPLDTAFGTPAEPLVLPYPFLFTRSSTIQVQLQNLNLTTAVTARLVFHGVKYF
jgi:hypothetical protein